MRVTSYNPDIDAEFMRYDFRMMSFKEERDWMKEVLKRKDERLTFYFTGIEVWG